MNANTRLPPFIPYPRFLLNRPLSRTAALVYALLLDRATLSQKNGWVDEQGRVYVVYTIENLAQTLHCNPSSIKRALNDLQNEELILRVRQGFASPSHILINLPPEAQERAVIQAENALCEGGKTGSMTVHKDTSNKLNDSQQNNNQQSREREPRRAYGEYGNVFLSESEVVQLKSEIWQFDSLLDELSAYMESTGRKYRNHAATLRIWARRSQEKDAALAAKYGTDNYYAFEAGDSL